MRDSEVLMLSGSVFHTWGALYLNHCNPQEVVVTLGRSNFRDVPLWFYAVVRPGSVLVLTLLLLIVAKIKIFKKKSTFFPLKSQNLNISLQMFFPKTIHLNGNNNTIEFLQQMQKLGICKIIFDSFVFPLFRNEKGKVTAVKNQGEVDL